MSGTEVKVSLAYSWDIVDTNLPFWLKNSYKRRQQRQKCSKKSEKSVIFDLPVYQSDGQINLYVPQLSRTQKTAAKYLL